MNVTRHRFRHLSAAIIFFVMLPFSEAVAEQTVYSLMVGINDYAEAENPAYAASDLQGPSNDVSILKALLIERYGVVDDEDHFKVLLDVAATHDRIAEAFTAQLTEKAKSNPNSTFLFYFSGHGSLAVDDNGDEGDGFDETLVAHDSRAAGGTDIIDDEIEEWLADLKQYTKNIVLIFDSCHSGTASKAPGMRSRRAPFDARQAKAKGSQAKDPASLDNPGRVYSVIAGSMAEEVSNEDLVETENGARYHGLLTYYLVQTLKRSTQLTYREAVLETERLVRKRAPSQHPQVEGDFDRIVFGGIGTRQTPFIPITAVTKESISVAVGQAQGIQEGAILAVYSESATKLVGEEGKIGEAIVSAADINSSIARLVGAGKEAVTTASKVRIVSPYSAGQKLPVAIAVPPAVLGIGADLPIKSRLAERLTDNALVKVDDDVRRAVLSVSIGCMDNKTLIPMEDAERLSPTCAKVYYISPKDQIGATYDFSIPANNEDAAVTAIIQTLEKIARQENLRSLANKASPIAASIQLSLLRVAVTTKDGKLIATNNVPVVGPGPEPMRVGEHFRFEVKNGGEQDIYFSIIGLGTSGAVWVLGDAPAGEKLQAGAKVTTKPALKVGPPLGLESYVLLATTSPTSVRFLENPGVRQRDPGPLGWLLDGLANPGFRDSSQVPELDLDSWATARLDIEIRP